MSLRIAHLSRIGARARNEDRYAVVETEQGTLLVLADGMGGHSGGDLAAQTVVETLRRSYLEAQRPLRDPFDFLRNALRVAHQSVRVLGQQYPPQQEPGSTAVACLIQGDSAYWVHVGDSRLYVFHDGMPLLHTRDHSYLERLADQGLLSSEERLQHPLRSMLTRCIGCTVRLGDIPAASRQLEYGDVLLLCSDGLWESLDGLRMGLLLRGRTLSHAIETMADAAEQGAFPTSDNITVVALAKVLDELAGAGDPHLEDALDQARAIRERYRDEMGDDG